MLPLRANVKMSSTSGWGEGERTWNPAAPHGCAPANASPVRFASNTIKAAREVAREHLSRVRICTGMLGRPRQ